MPQSSKARFFLLLKIGSIAIFGMVGLLLVGTLLNLVSYRSKVVPPINVIPSAESIGYEYLQAVTQKNSNYIPEDNECVHAQLLKDITQYDGAKVRNTVVNTKWESGNSDHQFEVTSIRFDYRFPRNPSWQNGEIRLLTATNLERGNSLLDALPFRRIHCAGAGI
jgi:hypothetical protein